MELLDRNPRIGIVYCKLNMFGSESGDWYWPPFSKEEMLYRNVIFTSAVFRKKDWMAAGKYKTDYLYAGEDWDLWLSLLELDVEVYQIPEVLFFTENMIMNREAQEGQRSPERSRPMNSLYVIMKNSMVIIWLRYYVPLSS